MWEGLRTGDLGQALGSPGLRRAECGPVLLAGSPAPPERGVLGACRAPGAAQLGSLLQLGRARRGDPRLRQWQKKNQLGCSDLGISSGAGGKEAFVPVVALFLPSLGVAGASHSHPGMSPRFWGASSLEEDRAGSSASPKPLKAKTENNWHITSSPFPQSSAPQPPPARAGVPFW